FRRFWFFLSGLIGLLFLGQFIVFLRLRLLYRLCFRLLLRFFRRSRYNGSDKQRGPDNSRNTGFRYPFVDAFVILLFFRQRKISAVFKYFPHSPYDVYNPRRQNTEDMEKNAFHRQSSFRGFSKKMIPTRRAILSNIAIDTCALLLML